MSRQLPASSRMRKSRVLEITTERIGSRYRVEVAVEPAPQRAALHFIVNHAAHLDLRLVVQSGGRPIRENLPFRPEAASGRGIDLGADGTFTESEPLSKWLYSLPPGAYDLSGEFYYPVNGVSLKTNVVHIVINP